MPSVYADPDDLISAARGLRRSATEVRAQAQPVAEIDLPPSCFGRAHHGHESRFDHSKEIHIIMGKLSECIASATNALDEYAAKLIDTVDDYEWVDTDAARELTNDRDS